MSKHEWIANPVTGDQKTVAALVDRISRSRPFVTPQRLGSITLAMTEVNSPNFANRCTEYATQYDCARPWVKLVVDRATSRLLYRK